MLVSILNIADCFIVKKNKCDFSFAVQYIFLDLFFFLKIYKMHDLSIFVGFL